MEGAAGSIRDLSNGWVRKTMKREQRAKGLPIEEQIQIQQWLHKELQPSKGYRILFAPDAREAAESPQAKSSFDLQKVVAGEPLQLSARPDAEEEVIKLWKAAYNAGYILNDLEYYEQPGGTIAVLDVDKVCWRGEGDTVICPFQGSWTLAQLVRQPFFSEELANRLLKALSRGRSRSR